jgi:hypothetical protein
MQAVVGVRRDAYDKQGEVCDGWTETGDDIIVLSEMERAGGARSVRLRHMTLSTQPRPQPS